MELLVILRKGFYELQAGEKYVVSHANQIRKCHEIDETVSLKFMETFDICTILT